MIKPGIYRHYKNKEYRVHFVAKHSESLEDYVVYEPLYKSDLAKFWIRPIAMFEEEVEVNGQKVKRFTFLKEN